jgi:hypothetical protein
MYFWIEAIHLGAWECLPKPVEETELKVVLIDASPDKISLRSGPFSGSTRRDDLSRGFGQWFLAAERGLSHSLSNPAVVVSLNHPQMPESLLAAKLVGPSVQGRIWAKTHGKGSFFAVQGLRSYYPCMEVQETEWRFSVGQAFHPARLPDCPVRSREGRKVAAATNQQSHAQDVSPSTPGKAPSALPFLPWSQKQDGQPLCVRAWPSQSDLPRVVGPRRMIPINGRPLTKTACASIFCTRSSLTMASRASSSMISGS